MQRYFRVGSTDFHWLFEREDAKPASYSLSPARDTQLKRARQLAKELGLEVELRERKRMNDYVGPPIWGKDHLIQILPLTDSRQRMSALAA